ACIKDRSGSVYEVQLGGPAEQDARLPLVGVAGQSDIDEVALRALRLASKSGDLPWCPYVGIANVYTEAVGDTAFERSDESGQLRWDVAAALGVEAGRFQDDLQAAEAIPALLE